MKEIGPFMSNILKYRSETQENLAKAVGLTSQQISYLMRGGANKWKVSYLDKACKFLKVHPMSFFDDWESEEVVKVENVENNSFLGVSTFNINSPQNANLLELLREKDERIKSLQEIINLQKIILEKNGESIDNI